LIDGKPAAFTFFLSRPQGIPDDSRILKVSSAIQPHGVIGLRFGPDQKAQRQRDCPAHRYQT
jgi:hypothetical protein